MIIYDKGIFQYAFPMVWNNHWMEINQLRTYFYLIVFFSCICYSGFILSISTFKNISHYSFPFKFQQKCYFCWKFSKFLMWNLTKHWRIPNQSWWTRINLSGWSLFLFFTLRSSESTIPWLQDGFVAQWLLKKKRKYKLGRKVEIRILEKKGRRRINM